MANKIYYPEVIQDTPFPTGGGNPFLSEGDSSTVKRTKQEQDTYVQKQIKDLGFPVKKVATELIGSAINTRAQRILKEFQFTQSGALQIGKFVLGESGDIRWTAGGMVARNRQGEETIAIDGETGDVAVKGRVQSRSLISGNITVGGNGNSEGYMSVLDADNVERVLLDQNGMRIYNGKIVIQNDSGLTSIDAKGIVSTSNFVGIQTATGSTSNVTLTSYVDIPGASITLTLTRDTVVFISNAVIGYLTENPPTTAGNGVVDVDINGTHYAPIYMFAGADFGLSFFNQRVLTLSAGTYTIKLVAKMDTVFAGTPAITPLGTRLTVVTLGF